MITILYEEGEQTIHTKEAARLPALLAESGRSFWLDMEAPTPDEMHLLESGFHFHPLAIEDAAHLHQRPKVDEYEGYFFLTAYDVIVDTEAYKREGISRSENGNVQGNQVSMFLGANFLVTLHTARFEAIHALRDRCDRNHRVLDKGADFLLYTLLDTLVDGYFPILDALDDAMDDLEDRIVARPSGDILETIFALKKDLTLLRKYAGPLREVVQALTTRDFPNIKETTVPYLRDVADHLFRIYETLDSYRDLMSNMLDAYLSQVSNEMNRVMQKLAAVGTVFLPITYITGVFGMNFANQPWLRTNFWLWMGVMGGVAAFTYWWFHRRHWV